MRVVGEVVEQVHILYPVPQAPSNDVSEVGHMEDLTPRCLLAEEALHVQFPTLYSQRYLRVTKRGPM